MLEAEAQAAVSGTECGVDELVRPHRVLRLLRGAQLLTVEPRRHTVDEPPLQHGAPHGFDLYPYTEDQVGAVKRSVLQWRFIDGIAAKLDGDELRAAQQAKDAVRAYELVYAALGA